jgi:molybdopterin synthase catalytic subunit
MFKLSDQPIAIDAARQTLQDDRAGAIATFEGAVRNHNEGKVVHALEYEAYGALAVREGERILEEAVKRFDVYRCVCIHRTGKLAIKEIAVWVGVSAAHRGEAFDACRFIIDEIKHRVPIWKKEHYADGDTGWVNCAHEHEQKEAHDPATTRERAAR